jgi:hypothetical protein
VIGSLETLAEEGESRQAAKPPEREDLQKDQEDQEGMGAEERDAVGVRAEERRSLTRMGARITFRGHSQTF